jgi:hypothetical protein
MKTKKTIPAELAHLSDVEIARRLGVSKQRIWQLRKAAAGHCVICGVYAERGSPFCQPHHEANKLRMRIYAGCNEWVPGGTGRPPKRFA